MTLFGLEGLTLFLGSLAAFLTALVAVLKNLDPLLAWWRSRRDRVEKEREARKTVRTLQETIDIKNVELESKDRIIERQDREMERMQGVINQQREHIARLQSAKGCVP